MPMPITPVAATPSAPIAAASPQITEDAAARAAADAFVFGYPLVLMDVTRQVSTASAHGAPVNQIQHRRAFPDATFTDVVSPNADTLYSLAWLDVSKEPMVLSVPEMGKRYYLMQLLSAWTNVFAAPGTRTTGSGKGEFAVVGPSWTGELPQGVNELRSPTNMVWLIGRTQTNGKDDYAAVHAVQDKFELTPLSARGKTYSPPATAPIESGIDTKTPPVEQLAGMDATTFYRRLNDLMKTNSPAKADAAALEHFADIGVGPGRVFDASTLYPVIARGIERGYAAGGDRLRDVAKKPMGRMVNGWDVLSGNIGKFGTDYLFRAVVALVGLGANLPEDAIYPHARVDAEGRPFNGADRYVVRFEKGQLPPVSAFWSLTMYNNHQGFVQNPLGRYAIGDRDHLRFDADGSLSLYIQHDSPGKDKESNWLPAPEDEFNVFMRMYGPKPAAFDGNWKPPPVERVR